MKHLLRSFHANPDISAPELDQWRLELDSFLEPRRLATAVKDGFRLSSGVGWKRWPGPAEPRVEVPMRTEFFMPLSRICTIPWPMFLMLDGPFTWLRPYTRTSPAWIFSERSAA